MKNTKKNRPMRYTTSEDVGGVPFAEMARQYGKGNASSMRYTFYRALEKILDPFLEYNNINPKDLSKEKREAILRSADFQLFVKDAMISRDLDERMNDNYED